MACLGAHPHPYGTEPGRPNESGHRAWEVGSVPCRGVLRKVMFFHNFLRDCILLSYNRQNHA